MTDTHAPAAAAAKEFQATADAAALTADARMAEANVAAAAADAADACVTDATAVFDDAEDAAAQHAAEDVLNVAVDAAAAATTCASKANLAYVVARVKHKQAVRRVEQIG